MLIQIYFYVLSTRLSREIFFQSERDRAQVNLDWNCDEFLKINSSQAGGKGKRGTAGVCIDEKR